jgi:hypothetical protein
MGCVGTWVYTVEDDATTTNCLPTKQLGKVDYLQTTTGEDLSSPTIQYPTT